VRSSAPEGRERAAYMLKSRHPATARGDREVHAGKKQIPPEVGPSAEHSRRGSSLTPGAGSPACGGQVAIRNRDIAGRSLSGGNSKVPHKHIMEKWGRPPHRGGRHCSAPRNHPHKKPVRLGEAGEGTAIWGFAATRESVPYDQVCYGNKRARVAEAVLSSPTGGHGGGRVCGRGGTAASSWCGDYLADWDTWMWGAGMLGIRTGALC